jgi:Domain of unknown function (DUF4922)
VNPFPIAPEHFTVPALAHTPQRINGALDTLLRLARDLSPRYTVFYNGPQCGASAPDHLHFQAVPAGFLPLDGDFNALRGPYGRVVRDPSDRSEQEGRPSSVTGASSCPRHDESHAGVPAEGQVCITVLGDLLCRCIALESADQAALEATCRRVLSHLEDLVPGDAEPMVNLIVRYIEGWRLLIIPRARHRPSLYPRDGGHGILLSPASVDLGGVCITPREEDFHRLERQHLSTILDEVCLGRDGLATLEKRLASGE